MHIQLCVRTWGIIIISCRSDELLNVMSMFSKFIFSLNNLHNNCLRLKFPFFEMSQKSKFSLFLSVSIFISFFVEWVVFINFFVKSKNEINTFFFPFLFLTCNFPFFSLPSRERRKVKKIVFFFLLHKQGKSKIIILYQQYSILHRTLNTIF